MTINIIESMSSLWYKVFGIKKKKKKKTERERERKENEKEPKTKKIRIF